jgi:hypothetical protein
MLVPRTMRSPVTQVFQVLLPMMERTTAVGSAATVKEVWFRISAVVFWPASLQVQPSRPFPTRVQPPPSAVMSQ